MPKEVLHKTDLLERTIYSEICSHEGIKAKDLGKTAGATRTAVNRYLYNAPFLKELCYQDADYCWHGLIRQQRPHVGLGDFCGFYAYVSEFLAMTEEEWFDSLLAGCRRIGRNLNDTRGLFHSFRDCREVMVNLLRDLESSCDPDWEVCFELRIRRARYIRIYADVLLITNSRVYSLEFKMKDTILPEEVLQAAKYTEYLEVLFGPGYDVIPALVLTRARDLYDYAPLPGTDAAIPVLSGDLLFNLVRDYE